MEFKIEEGIPMPEKVHINSRCAPLKQALLDLRDGACVFVSKGTHRSVTYVVQVARKQTGYAYPVRNADGGVRIWRGERKRAW